jgi:hypothetical protein
MLAMWCIIFVIVMLFACCPFSGERSGPPLPLGPSSITVNCLAVKVDNWGNMCLSVVNIRDNIPADVTVGEKVVNSGNLKGDTQHSRFRPGVRSMDGHCIARSEIVSGINHRMLIAGETVATQLFVYNASSIVSPVPSSAFTITYRSDIWDDTGLIIRGDRTAAEQRMNLVDNYDKYSVRVTIEEAATAMAIVEGYSADAGIIGNSCPGGSGTILGVWDINVSTREVTPVTFGDASQTHSSSLAV